MTPKNDSMSVGKCNGSSPDDAAGPTIQRTRSRTKRRRRRRGVDTKQGLNGGGEGGAEDEMIE